MDDFGFERPELNGALLSLEFGDGGRIRQLWGVDPSGQDGDEFQFVLSPMSLDEEFVEEYYPGTILIGARTKPEDPWILSRNSEAKILDYLDDPTQVGFEYDFSLLPEIGATGRFFEEPGLVPKIVWEIRIENKGRVSLEIGELGFPLALNNFYGGYGGDTSDHKGLLNDRLVLHKSIAGAGSYLYAQRLNAKPPGLIVAPGPETWWEFYASVPSTLGGPDPWPGIPVVYIYSAATIEREGWEPWFNGHQSLIMEPGDTRVFRTLFMASESGESDGALATLAAAGQPTIGLFPCAVIPADVGVTVQLAGATPAQVFSDGNADLEPESEEGRGSCFVLPDKPGPLKFSFEDTQGRVSHCHLLFTEPIEKLIDQRAKWICENQVQKDGWLAHGILASEYAANSRATDPDEYVSESGITNSLSDALFLASKNAIYPDIAQIAILEDYIENFLERLIIHPTSGAVHWRLTEDDGPATNASASVAKLLAGRLYLAMHELGARWPTKRSEADYLAKSLAIVEPRNRRESAGPNPEKSVRTEISHLEGLLGRIALPHRFSFTPAGDGAVKASAWYSLAPHWWAYGSANTSFGPPEIGAYVESVVEAFPGPRDRRFWAITLRLIGADDRHVSPGLIRTAFGHYMAPWALVRADGAAAGSFCPDAGSRSFGVSASTGDLGAHLSDYLQTMSAIVAPIQEFAFGCHFSIDDQWTTVTPWDGIGQRIWVRSYGVWAEAKRGVIRELRFKRDRSMARLKLFNPFHEAATLRATIVGLWGNRIAVKGDELKVDDGAYLIEAECPAGEEIMIEIEVMN